jgi:AcrR family transcriptional regulator
VSKSRARNARAGARIPVQQRGIETRKRLMEAGERAFARRGYHDVIADEIAREAGVAVGSFYAYFNNKHALFLEMLDDYTARGVQAINESLASFPLNTTQQLEQPIAKMISVLIDMHKDSPELLKESLRMALYDEEIKERVERISGLVLQILQEALSNMNRKLKKRERESIAYMLYYAVEGVVHRMTLNEDKIDQKRVMRELSRMVASYTSGLIKPKTVRK